MSVIQGKIVLDDELVKEIGKFGYRRRDPPSKDEIVTLKIVNQVDVQSIERPTITASTRAQPSLVDRMGHIVSSAVGTSRVAGRLAAILGHKQKRKTGALKQLMLQNIVADASDDIFRQMGELGEKARKELTRLDPATVARVLDLNRDLQGKERDRRRRMDALGIFPPEYNEVRARTMLRVEHRRAMVQDQRDVSKPKRAAGVRGAGAGTALSSSQAPPATRGSLNSAGLGPSVQLSRATSPPGKRASSAMQRPGPALPVDGSRAPSGGTAAGVGLADPPAAAGPPSAPSRLSFAEGAGGRQPLDGQPAQQPSTSASTAPLPGAPSMLQGRPSLAGLRPASQAGAAGAAPPPMQRAATLQSDTGTVGTVQRPSSIAGLRPGTAERTLPPRLQGKDHTLLARLEALVEDIDLLDVPAEVIAASKPFTGLRRARLVDVDLMREAFDARRREKEEDEIWEGEGGGADHGSGPAEAKKRRDAVNAARRQRTVNEVLSRYRDQRRGALSQLVDCLDLEGPSEELRVAAWVQRALTIKMRRQEEEEAAVEAADNELALDELHKMGTRNLMLIAKIGMMDALGQLEYFMDDDRLGGGSAEASDVFDTDMGPSGPPTRTASVAAARIRLAHATAKNLMRSLQEEGSNTGFKSTLVREEREAVAKELSVPVLYREATLRSGTTSLEGVVAQVEAGVMQERAKRAVHDLERTHTLKGAASIRFREEDLDPLSSDDSEFPDLQTPLPGKKAKPTVSVSMAASPRGAATGAGPSPALPGPSTTLVRAGGSIRVLQALKSIRAKDVPSLPSTTTVTRPPSPPPPAPAVDPAIAPSAEDLKALSRSLAPLDPVRAAGDAVGLGRLQPGTPGAFRGATPAPVPRTPASPLLPPPIAAALTPASATALASASGHYPPRTPVATVADTLQARLETVWELLRFPAALKALMAEKYTLDDGASKRFSDALRVWEVAAAAVVQREAALRHLVQLQPRIVAGLGLTDLSHLREVISAIRVSHGTVMMTREALHSSHGDQLQYEGRAYPPESIDQGELRSLWAYAVGRSQAGGMIPPGAQLPPDPFL